MDIVLYIFLGLGLPALAGFFLVLTVLLRWLGKDTRISSRLGWGCALGSALAWALQEPLQHWLFPYGHF